MTSPEKWIYNEISKNKKNVASVEKKYKLQGNSSTDCDICELLKESSIELARLLPSKLILVAIAGLLFVSGSGTVYTSIFNKCEAELEKIEGQCIDPFLQSYKQAIRQGDEAILLGKNYKSISDLQKAQLSLNDAVKQLMLIPPEAVIYSKTAAKLTEYEKKKRKISNNLEIETVALNKLQESEKTAEEAKTKTSGNPTPAELKLAQEKWLEAKIALEEVDFSSLSIAQAEAYRLNYEREIRRIDRRLSAMAKSVRFTIPKNTYQALIKTYKRVKGKKYRSS